ncbi:hypothetical protein BOQ62_13670 [Chryseobacterium sp. CH21]|uniref:NAD(P)-dependent oxidoreductase n=1 Tax=Chryseobacterium sp. CH21 TaxID=713556 RepID=UPI00100AD11B|nr:DUF1932 domain-containing protein [Chryseobacterium sp. CH21]RXM39117.1 hypothetical protein BOQ62_13670 [Chryseobacterium sp. CH21]
MKNNTSKITIAILYPGDMGFVIAKELIKNDFRIVSVSEGRSELTKKNIKNAGIEDLPSIKELAEVSDYILSLNSPKSSITIAKEVAESIAFTQKKAVFVDLNSNSPETALEIEKMMIHSGTRFINGAVMGASQDIPHSAVFVLSGKETQEFITLLSPIFKIKNAGDQTVSASAYKLLFSMVNKGINALFFETMIAAAHFGILDELNESLMKYLPGTYEDLKKTTPTYPQHIKRRIDEMNGLSEMLQTENLPNGIALTAAQIFEKIYNSGIFEDKTPKTVTETFEYFKTIK